MKKLKIISALALFMAVSFVSFGQMKKVPVYINAPDGVNVTVSVLCSALPGMPHTIGGTDNCDDWDPNGDPWKHYSTIVYSIGDFTNTYKATIDIPSDCTKLEVQVRANVGTKSVTKIFKGVNIVSVSF